LQYFGLVELHARYFNLKSLDSLLLVVLILYSKGIVKTGRVVLVVAAVACAWGGGARFAKLACLLSEGL
jgi:hypothetical protein